MRTLAYKPRYQNWSGVPGNTVPGRCYSIAELLMRVQRNQPLPLMNTYQEQDDGRNSDEDVAADMQAAEAHPFFDRDADEVDAWNAKQDIEERMNHEKK